MIADLSRWRWPNFTPDEFRCRCCGEVLMDEAFMDALQNLRSALGFPVPVTSGYRCPAHNKAVSSSGLDGPHTTGKAADIGVFGSNAHRLLRIAVQTFPRIGVNQKGAHKSRFIHLDTLTEADGEVSPWIWTY